MSLPPSQDTATPVIPHPSELDVFLAALLPADKASNWPDLRDRDLTDHERAFARVQVDRLSILLSAWERTELAQDSEGSATSRQLRHTYGNLIPPLLPTLKHIRVLLEDGSADEAAIADLRVVETLTRLLVHWSGYPSDALVALLADETGYGREDQPQGPTVTWWS